MPKAFKNSEKSARPLLGIIILFERPNLKGRRVWFDISKHHFENFHFTYWVILYKNIGELRKDKTFGLFFILPSTNWRYETIKLGTSKERPCFILSPFMLVSILG
ncbi:MAG: hypothetical protein N3A56_06625 [Thermodesulfobacteriaceae bacterium]|nr:hypothetical protein [Thermodesulfobacteriaceae bacterium]